MITSYFAPKKPRASAKRDRDADGEKTSDKRSKDLVDAVGARSDSKSAVLELLSSLDERESCVCWRKELARHLDSASFASLASFVAKERLVNTVYPPVADTWSALNLTPLDQVRVVIIGQDPYHGPGQAHGLCFSVLPGQAIPPSLKNVYRELNEDSQIKFLMPRHGHLIRWAKQGVLMLNACMSVRRGEANSHQKKGWENLTDEIVRAVDRQSKKSGQRVVFLLWGKPATAKAQALIGSNSSVNRHVVICTSHPSPLGARKTNQPFLGSKCFSRCNQALTEMGCGAIDWNVDD
jgi:uracil-DNA glycosylase